MITTEELYIIRDGGRQRVDLSSPSGITLSYESNLFNAIDKVNCSHSYTIKLPKTVNNTRIFDIPQDVRMHKSVVRQRFGCEYVVDGVPLFKRGNAYVVSIDDSINVVVTWDVVSGLQKIKYDNFDINLFDVKEGVETAMVKQKGNMRTSEPFNNFDAYYLPSYYAGVKQYYNDSHQQDSHQQQTQGEDNYRRIYALPVVPVPYLLRRIENYYDIRIDVYKNAMSNGKMDFMRLPDAIDTVDLGVIPCVGTKLTYEQQERGMIRLTNFTWQTIPDITPSALRSEDEMMIYTHDCEFKGDRSGDFFEYIMPHTDLCHDKYVEWGVKPKERHTIKVRGVVKVIYKLKYVQDWLEDGKSFALKFYYKKTEGWNHVENVLRSSEEAASVEGVVKYADEDEDFKAWLDTNRPHWTKYNQEYACVVYEIRSEEGVAPVTIDLGQMNNVFTTITYDEDLDLSDKGKSYVWVLNTSWLEFLPENAERTPEHYQDLISNLPSVTCLDFVKSLFYQIGAYPVVTANGVIKPFYYRDIKKNLAYAYDWSKKIMSDSVHTFTWKVGSFSRRNYYLMKSDESEEDKIESPSVDPSLPKDVYEEGRGVIVVNSDTDNTNTIVVTLPWYAPFIRAEEKPKAETGNTMKYWVFGNTEAKEAKPCYGVLSYGRLDDGDEKDVIRMKVWNGFKDMQEDDYYGFLAKLMKDPIVMKCDLLLNALELYELDMSRPAYIEEVNSYFCIIKVERSSNGICTAELLRIPPEAL